MDTPVKQVSHSGQMTISQKMNVKNQLAKIYRLFSSKKYMKYKHQFPRMKETEIVNKIIKEWQLMSMQEKLGLGEVYSKKEMLDSESDEEGSNFSEDNQRKSTMQKSGVVTVKKSQPVKKIQTDERKIENKRQQTQSPVLETKIQQLSTAINKIQLQSSSQAKQNQQKSKVEHSKEQQQSQQSQSQLGRPVKHKVQEKKEIQLQGIKYKAEEQSQSQRQSSSQSSSHEDNSESESSQKRKGTKKLTSKKEFQQHSKTGKRKVIKKEKPIKKQINYSQLKNGQYLLFYKYYFQKLRQQHPKWSETQITFIIKLLWKKHSQKRKLNNKEVIEQERKMKKQITNPPKPKRPISGKEYFGNEKRNQHLSKQEINMLWKELPRESKSYWNKMAAQFNKKNATKSTNIKTDSNIKAETTPAKTQNSEKKPKTTVVTFRDLLLKGRVTHPIINDNIIEQKKESLHAVVNFKQSSPQNSPDQTMHQNQSQRVQNINYVSLQANPFAFMMKKIDNKILLE